jgi:hypothetical protein
VRFTYLVIDTGLLTLNGIVLVDDGIGTVTCPNTTLTPGEKMTCTSASYPAISGHYDNVATVTGQPVDPSGNNAGPPLTDTDKGNYTNGELPTTGSSSDLLAQLGGLLLMLGSGSRSSAGAVRGPPQGRWQRCARTGRRFVEAPGSGSRPQPSERTSERGDVAVVVDRCGGASSDRSMQDVAHDHAAGAGGTRMLLAVIVHRPAQNVS